jgi:hypothetical protein
MELKRLLEMELSQSYDVVISDDGYLYADGKFPVLLVAHMDTVHKELPKHIIYTEKGNKVSSPTGIGGDDRCGIYMILQIIKKYHCSVLFCEDEEIGGVGADKFIASPISRDLKFNYIIEFDRKGSNDAVFYNCDNEDFEKFITKDFFKTAYGSFSDISVIAPALKCAAVNLSCGYYNAHTEKEYVLISEMRRVIDEACKILERTTDSDVFEYVESEYSYYRGGGWYNDDYYNYYDSKYGSKNNSLRTINYYIVEYYDQYGDSHWIDFFADTKEEALGQFFIDHPDRCFNDVVDIYIDKAYY